MNILHPLITDDGTISLYSEAEKDIYHSKIGAYTESLQKFVVPSKIISHVMKNNDVRILDICFGPGYNSKVALNEIYSVNPACDLTIDCLELDPCVLMLAGIIGLQQVNNSNMLPFRVLAKYLTEMSQYKACYDELYEEIKKQTILEPHLEEFKKSVIETSSNDEIRSVLHNIYYRTVSNSNKNIENIQYKSNKLDIAYYIGDARDAISVLSQQYDCIFLDGFTPSKAPMVWTVEFIKQLYRLIGDIGCVVTYTSSAAVRSAFIEVGFYIYRTYPVGRNSSGTIAFKEERENELELPNQQRGILDTKAGIPYRDVKMSLCNADIIELREKSKAESGRVTSSAYLKDYKQLHRAQPANME